MVETKLDKAFDIFAVVIMAVLSTLGILAIVLIVFDDSPPQCQQMATTLEARDNEWLMHYFGCAKPEDKWIAADGECNEAARRAAKLELSEYQFNMYVGRDHGCVLYEDGSWGAE